MTKHTRTQPSPGRDFEFWMDSGRYTSVRDVRKVGIAFADWIRPAHDVVHREQAAIFGELTRLTLDLIAELRQIRTRGRLKLFATVQRRRPPIESILTRIHEEYPSRLHLLDRTSPDGMPLFRDRPASLGATRTKTQRGARQLDALGIEFQMLSRGTVVAAALRRFRFLYEHGAFAKFRRCALPTCKRYFFPQRTEARYCAKACQRQHYLQDPSRKNKNAADQRVHYYAKKVLDLAKLAAANPSYRKEYGAAKKALKQAEAERRRLKRR